MYLPTTCGSGGVVVTNFRKKIKMASSGHIGFSINVKHMKYLKGKVTQQLPTQVKLEK